MRYSTQAPARALSSSCLIRSWTLLRPPFWGEELIEVSSPSCERIAFDGDAEPREAIAGWGGTADVVKLRVRPRGGSTEAAETDEPCDANNEPCALSFCYRRDGLR